MNFTSWKLHVNKLVWVHVGTHERQFMGSWYIQFSLIVSCANYMHVPTDIVLLFRLVSPQAQSSAKSTPEKRSATWQSGGAAVRPTFSHSEQLDRQMAAFAPVEAMGEDASDGASEGEITSSVS